VACDIIIAENAAVVLTGVAHLTLPFINGGIVKPAACWRRPRIELLSNTVTVNVYWRHRGIFACVAALEKEGKAALGSVSASVSARRRVCGLGPWLWPPVWWRAGASCSPPLKESSVAGYQNSSMLRHQA